ncbi:SigB/SigF/SigG family RNA polymerase sigma factor [Streptomyces sp. NBC_01304]|uniref:SigB/SigF/SigG family RNA polymerase sigma factor n=1 Tax=Streptomyces sp. NBC_01304 TaxID=2903818 RepID=UPI002E10F9A2|nr:SigB/SigF/SigG family RNA polymerase sigma factor [Streptomyces sp. NBC_01304]
MTYTPAQSTRGARRTHPHDDSPDTTAAFARIAALPDGPEKSALQQEVVCVWMPMAVRLARRYQHRGESFEDLVQVAHLGLVKAVSRFDPERGAAFPSFAIPTILGAMKRHFRDGLWGVHVPRHVQELRMKVRAASGEMGCSLDSRGPTIQEIAAYTGLTEAEVRLGQGALESFALLSLDAGPVFSADGRTLADTLGDVEPGFDWIVNREALRPLLKALPEREQKILYLRFFREMTQRSIAEQFGISQMHVSRLISGTCARLRDQVMAETDGLQKAS